MDMSDKIRSLTFLKTERGRQLIDELMDIVVEATLERIVTEDALRANWNRAGFSDEQIDRLGLLTHRGGKN